MNILFIGPLPPPINGHSLVCGVLHNGLSRTNHLLTVDLKKQGLKDGLVSWMRMKEIFRVFIEAFKRKRNANVVYFTISESLAGNLKDIIIYLICYNLLSKCFIHLHGGSIKKLLFDKYPLLHKLNSFFISKMAGVIISGESHLEIFGSLTARNKIHIIPNFAKDELFIEPSAVTRKFADTDKLRLLFISNMIPLKGYLLLVEAFLALDDSIAQHFSLDFAGRFDSEEERLSFEEKIKDNVRVKYHGVISDDQKKQLFQEAHIFILPTMFFEGQPVSILEAYSTGCVVITTGQSGILDVFKDDVNGFLIQENSTSSISQALANLLNQKERLAEIAGSNLSLARKEYRVEHYVNRIRTAIGAD
ncbi:glycosyltransferase family 4 protein [Leptospira idonii]|uniref:Glycosyltransferase n=1 Tax=Leptospira idonii TaxID=1193500 RepID=A0A4R9LVK7_9LEPT|nr:glycosyltransferase family 4 protein [Leptospira idonii]TGN18283.1 glycosyltransferase [Leptospira idonii]